MLTFLFKTEDGVDIYPTDSYYAVQTKKNLGDYYYMQIQKITIDKYGNFKSNIHKGLTAFSGEYSGVKRFSTRKKAELFIKNYHSNNA